MPDKKPSELELPDDWPYYFIGGSSSIVIEPLLECLKVSHSEWKVRGIKTGNLITEEWVDEYLPKNDGWETAKNRLLRQNIVVLIQKFDRIVEPLGGKK